MLEGPYDRHYLRILLPTERGFQTPSADPKGNLFSDPFRATGITVSVLHEIRRVCFFFPDVSKDFISIDRGFFVFLRNEMDSFELSSRIFFLFYV